MSQFAIYFADGLLTIIYFSISLSAHSKCKDVMHHIAQLLCSCLIKWDKRQEPTQRCVVIPGQTRRPCAVSRPLARRTADYRRLPSRRQYRCRQSWRRWRVWSQSAIAATAFAWAGWPSTDTWRRWGPCAAFGSSSMRRWKEESRR